MNGVNAGTFDLFSIIPIDHYEILCVIHFMLCYTFIFTAGTNSPINERQAGSCTGINVC